MKKLLVMSALVLSSMLATAQTAKVLRVKSYKDGKIIGTKTYNIIQPINVTQTKIVPKTRTITKTKIVKVPKIEYKLVEVPTKATALDTTAILQQYYPKKVQWYVGPNFTSNVKQPFLSFGASVLRKSLSDNIFQISIGTTVHEGVASPTPYFGFGGYFKIK